MRGLLVFSSNSWNVTKTERRGGKDARGKRKEGGRQRAERNRPDESAFKKAI